MAFPKFRDGTSSDQQDRCVCSRPCSYPNGCLAILLAQFFLLGGFICSAVVLVDCQLVHAKSVTVDPFLASLFPMDDERSNITNYPDRQHTALGFFFFEDIDGNCLYDMPYNETTFEAYMNFTNDWQSARIMAAISVVLALVLNIWLATWSCWAHPAVMRYIYVFLVFPLLTLFQGLTLLALGSDFCDDQGCVLGRASGIAILGMICFTVSAGIIFFGTHGYSADPLVQDHPVVVMSSEFVVDDVPADGIGDAQEVDPALVMLDGEQPSKESLPAHLVGGTSNTAGTDL